VLLFEDSLPKGVEGLPTLEEDFLADILVPLENLWIESATTVLTFLSWVILVGSLILRVSIQVFRKSPSFVFERFLGSKAGPKFLACTQTDLSWLLIALARV